MVDDDFTFDLKHAAVRLRMPQHTVIKCISHTARPNGGIKLNRKDDKGDTYFRETDLREYLDDLKKPWVDDPKAPRPEIPAFFKDALRIEVRHKCGLCGSPYATEFSHIIPYKTCLHNHPWNLLCLCPGCHTGYDVEQRITQDEVQRAKDRAQATFVDDLQYTVTGERCLKWLHSIKVPIGDTFATGIDLLMSTIHGDAEHLQISKVRGMTLLSHLGDGSGGVADLVKLTELFAAHLSQGRLAEPFWEEFANYLYSMNLFPDIGIGLDRDGVEMMEHFRNNAVDYVEPYKYPKFNTLKAAELVQKISDLCRAEQEWLDKKDRLPNLELNDDSV